jgi:hypothetical protein
MTVGFKLRPKYAITTGVVCCAKLADQAFAGGFQSGGMNRGEGGRQINPRGSLQLCPWRPHLFKRSINF